MDEIDYPGDEAAKDYDFLGFDDRDDIDAQTEADLRALTTGLPARPGTRRPLVTARRLG